jgi:hypothetical protein
VTFSWEPASLREPPHEDGQPLLTRAARAHFRLSWSQRLTRNARPADAPRPDVLLHGLPTRFFETFGSKRLAVA